MLILSNIYQEIISAISGSIASVNNNKVIEFLTLLNNANCVFFRGKGRSLLVAKALAMRLMHLNYKVEIIGAITTPPVKEGDLLIIVSGSGSIKSNGRILDTAKKLGAKTVAFTANNDSYIAINSDLAVIISANDISSNDGFNYESRQLEGISYNLTPLGTLFELSAMILFDTIIAYIIGLKKETEENIRARHANIE
jgi:6-phospho-3-hexuloisomerase